MDEKELNEIEARIDAASPDEWSVLDFYNYWGIQAGVGTLCLIAKTSNSDPLPLADAELIAHAKPDLRKLLTEVRQLRADFCHQLFTAAIEFGHCGDVKEIEEFVCWQFGHSGIPYDAEQFFAEVDDDRG